MHPPFIVTPKMIEFISDISKLVGNYESLSIARPSPKLRKQNKIKTIKSTLAIEGNSFTYEQINAVIDNKRVIGNQREIKEVQNAIMVYDTIHNFNPYSIKSFLKAHKILMSGLVDKPGNWRNKNVGVLDGSQVRHIAPKPIRVPALMTELFTWLKNDKETHFLIKSAIMHYEIEFIHPFEDGNGRMGRFWQTLLLCNNETIFEYLPIETLIESEQEDYYKALQICDKKGDSTLFIEFILKNIRATIHQFFLDLDTVTITIADRLEKAKKTFKNDEFSRKDYLGIFKNISTATASRDLKYGLEQFLLNKSGAKNKTRYLFK